MSAARRRLVAAGPHPWARELAAALEARGWERWPRRRRAPRDAFILRLDLPPPLLGGRFGLGLVDPDTARPARRRLLAARPLCVPSRFAARRLEARLGIPAEACVVAPSGHEHLVSAAELAAPAGPGPPDPVAAPVLVLSPPRREADALDLVRRALADAGLPPRPVTALAARPAGERRLLLEEALALVAATERDPVGLAAVEALACGCPVVASDRGAVPEAAGPVLLSFDPGDIRELGRHLLRLAEDPPWRRELAARGRARAAGRRWADAAARVDGALTPWLER